MVPVPPRPLPPQLKFYYSSAHIQQTGDNTGTIFNPACLVYTGDGFRLDAGQSLMIVPLQPDNVSPWKMFKTALFDHRFVRNKTARTLCYILTNQWMYRSIPIERGSTLNWILAHPGITHTMGYMTAFDLARLKSREHVYKEEDEDEDEDEGNNDEEDEEENTGEGHDVAPPSSTQDDPISRSISSSSSTHQLSSGVCHHARVSSCCHHVDIIQS
jgi:hypothetical protein